MRKAESRNGAREARTSGVNRRVGTAGTAQRAIPTTNDSRMRPAKNLLSGLEITSLGKPYKEGPNSWVLAPYSVRFKNGGTQTNNLRPGKDPDGSWHWQGGF